MRDAFGGTMMITILMIFIVIFVSFTAVIVNVAKTFRIKNSIINVVEQSQYNGSDISKIEEYMDNVYYYVSDSEVEKSCIDAGGKWGSKGYCIAPGTASNSKNKTPDYYKVTVYVSISLPFFDINMTLPISGETKSVQTLS